MIRLQTQQYRLLDAVRIYDYITTFYLRSPKTRHTPETIVLCDTLYELHSKLHRVEEELRLIILDEDALEKASRLTDERFELREYDV